MIEPGKAAPPQGPIDRLDRFQQRHRPTAVAVASLRKYRDDGGRSIAAAVALYGLMSLFPLLLLLVSVLGYALGSDPTLRDRLLKTAFGQFPVVNDQLTHNIKGLSGHGLGLAVGVIGLLWGARGVIRALLHAMEVVWGPAHGPRPRLLARLGRGAAFLGLLVGGLVATTFLASVATFGGRSALVGLAGLASSLVVSVGVFAMVFRVLAPRRLSLRAVFPGSVVAAVGWVGLQAAGSFLVGHILRRASQLYGVFGTSLGLVVFLLLVAQITVVAAEVNAVLAVRSWPVSLRAPPAPPAPPARAARG